MLQLLLICIKHFVNLLDKSNTSDNWLSLCEKSHSSIKLKLKAYGFHGKLHLWMTDYLKNRTQAVVCEGFKSRKKPVLRGVPQGSILGPLLFIMYINDLMTITNVEIYFYADDAKLMHQVSSALDCMTLQLAVTEVHTWSQVWGLTFNPSKCNVISFNRKSSIIEFVYTMDGNPLQRATSLSDLGLLVDDRLKWDNHIGQMNFGIQHDHRNKVTVL